MVFGEDGIFTKAKQQKIMQNKAEILQELELAKSETMIVGEGYTDLSKYLKYIQDIGLNSHKVTNIEQVDSVNAIITVDKEYVYTAAQIGNDVIINEIGYVKQVKPEIEDLKIIETTTNSITIEVSSRRTNKYKFLIREKGTQTYKEVTKTVNNENKNEIEKTSYKYSSLSDEKNYEIKVIAINKNGQDEKSINDNKVIGMQTAEGNIIFTSKPDKWTNENIETTMQIKEESLQGYTIQYQIDATTQSLSKDSQSWIIYNSEEPIISQKNEIIYVRLWDGVNGGNYAIKYITKIDKEEPTGSIQVSTTTNKLTVTVNASDVAETQINGCSQIKGYYYSKDNGTTYTTITTNTSYTFEGLTQGTQYQVKVKVEDNAGNVTILSEQKETQKIGTPTINISNANDWKNSAKAITITTLSGYTTKYTINGTTPSASNGTTYTGQFSVGSNCTVKAVYIDSINQTGTVASSNVTKIDTTPPTKPSIVITDISITGGGWRYTISTSSSDSGSGIKEYTYRDGYNGEIFGTTTSTTLKKSGNGWFAYGNICVKVVDQAGNESWSDSIYLNTRRLYIRQLYWANRNNYSAVSETEIDGWDYNSKYSKMAIITVATIDSNEMVSRYTDISNYIDRCYLGILGRSADAGGKSNMIAAYNQYGGGAYGRGKMLELFFNSTEAQNIYNNQTGGAGTLTFEEVDQILHSS